MTIRPIAACVAALAVAAGSAANANLITNGSFEQAQLAGPARAAIDTLTDWGAAGGFMLLEQGVNAISNSAAQTGTQFVSMGHNAATGDTLFQSFPTDPGQSYVVSFYLASIQGSQAQELEASITDTASTNILTTSTASIANAADGWQEHTFSFTATGATSQLTFVHTVGGSSANIALDSVSVVVPAPASALALIGLAGIRRRR